MSNSLLCYFVKLYPFGGFKLQRLLKVPGYGLTFSIRVRCEIDCISFFDRLFQAFKHIFPLGDDVVFRREIVIDVHAEIFLWQVTHMAHRCLDPVIRSKEPLERACFSRRLHNDE
jgi:hypothetical protein